MRVITNTLEVLSSSRTEEAAIFCGLSPILICPNTRVVLKHKSSTRITIGFITRCFSFKNSGKTKIRLSLGQPKNREQNIVVLG